MRSRGVEHEAQAQWESGRGVGAPWGKASKVESDVPGAVMLHAAHAARIAEGLRRIGPSFATAR
eukprot:52518-Alexandrium_andersonii.AAC.1